MTTATKKVSLAGRKRTKDLQASTAQLDATKQALREMQQDDTPASIEAPAQNEQPTAVAEAVQTPEVEKAAPKVEKAAPKVEKAAPKVEAEPQVAQRAQTQSKAASAPEKFEADAVKYLLNVYHKLCGSSENRFDYSPYQRHQKLITYFKKVVNARAEVHAADGMPLDQNQAICQQFVDTISAELKRRGIELNPLKVIPE